MVIRLPAGRSGVQIPVRASAFLHNVYTGSEAHTASWAKGTEYLFTLN